MANDGVQCSDADLEPFMRNTLALQLGNSTIDTADSTDVGIVSFNNIMVRFIYCLAVVYNHRLLLNLRRKLGKWLIIDRVVLVALPIMLMMLYGLWPLE